MMSVSVEYVMGYEIEAHAKTLQSDPPPHVSLRRLGGEASTYFTPDEARNLADAVRRGASAAERCSA